MNYINHIALVLDASGSMQLHKNELIKIADEQIKYLAQRSKEMDQETRVTVYTFNQKVDCKIYDKDVLRLPSIASLYNCDGQTALIASVLKSQTDLAATAQLYGDHSFLTFILTDGQENCQGNVRELSAKIKSLPDNWTVAVLVPNQQGKAEAKCLGFPSDNIAIWDTTTKAGLEEAGKTIKAATDNWMTGRKSGIRGSSTLFMMSADNLNKDTIKAAGLTPLKANQFVRIPVPSDCVIKKFVEDAGLKFTVGTCFYQLSKTETIQANKEIAVVEKKTAKVYSGASARSMLGLPDTEVRVKHDYNPLFDVFVQSTSVNRKLIAGTKLIVMK